MANECEKSQEKLRRRKLGFLFSSREAKILPTVSALARAQPDERICLLLSARTISP